MNSISIKKSGLYLIFFHMNLLQCPAYEITKWLTGNTQLSLDLVVVFTEDPCLSELPLYEHPDYPNSLLQSLRNQNCFTLFYFHDFSSCRGVDKKNVQHPSELTGIFRYCRKGEVGEMVLHVCDSSSYKHGWFHSSCVNLSSPPTVAWVCPDCRQ